MKEIKQKERVVFEKYRITAQKRCLETAVKLKDVFEILFREFPHEQAKYKYDFSNINEGEIEELSRTLKILLNLKDSINIQPLLMAYFLDSDKRAKIDAIISNEDNK